MKKVLSVVLSVMMILTCMLPVFAAEKTYDVAKVANGEVADLTSDQIADVLLDWIDKQIAKQAESFNNFEIEVMGQTVSANIEVNGLEDLLQYVDYLDQLGGDFANLTEGREALKALKRADGGVNFIKGFVDFMAANADVLGKVFRWDNAQFDLGNVGTFIDESDLDEVKDAYNYYKYDRTNKEGKTFNIQDSFVSEIAREMGYTIPDGQGFDDVLNNGIKAWFSELTGMTFSEDYNLKTTDIYTLVKKFVGDLQTQYKGALDDVAGKLLSAVQNAVKAIKDNLTFDPPTVTISDGGSFSASYNPTSADIESYLPKIYSPYKEQLAGTEYDDMIAGEALPAPYAEIVAGEGADMEEKFVFDVTDLPEDMTLPQGITLPMEISFAEIEEKVNAEIAAKLPEIQAQVDAAVAQAIASGNSLASALGITLEGSVVINSVTVSLAYKGYATDNDFIVEVTVVPAYDISFNGNVWDYARFVNITPDSIKADYIEPAVNELLTNPAATVLVTNLKGGAVDALAKAQALMNIIDTEAAYDSNLFDLVTNYDDYKGAIGQMNRILVDAANMILTDEAEAELALTPGGNENFDGNLDKILAYFNDKVAAVEEILSDGQLAEFAAIAGVDYAGFDAGLVSDLDFSSKEALLCGVLAKAAGIIEIDNELVRDIAGRIKDLDTLDAMAAAAADLVFAKLANAAGIDYTAIDYANVAEDGARDAIYNKVDDMLFAFAEKCVPAANKAANDLLAKAGLELGEVSFTLGVTKTGSWETDFAALVDRFIALTDGLCIPATEAKSLNGLWAKASKLITVLPMNTMLSNYTDLATLDADFFDKALDADIGSFLKYFEVKDDEIAGNVSVTKALINASDYIVDKFFPDTVEAQLYTASETVQQEFTGNDSDQGIAARNMVSIKNRADDVIPAILNLIRESGILPSLACDHATKEPVAEVPATCAKAGSTAGEKCTVCGKTFGVEEIPVKAHEWSAWTVKTPATCVAAGVETRTCAAGGETEEREIPATGKHNYVDGRCPVCNAEEPAADQGDNGGEQKTGFAAFWQRIVNFFNRIRNFFRNLFRR